MSVCSWMEEGLFNGWPSEKEQVMIVQLRLKFLVGVWFSTVLESLKFIGMSIV
jgi:hypothetical protein